MPTEFFLDKVWLIPLFPLAGAALMVLAGKRLQNSAVSAVCVGSVFVSFVFSLGAVWQLLQRPAAERVAQKILFEWVPAGLTHTGSGKLVNFVAEWGLLLDPLSAVMILVVTGVGFLIHFYSIGYMAHEGGYYRFFGYMNLFMFSMLTLVLANNMLLMFVGWEGVGLCSYLLIGFYFLRKSAADAGKKAFIVNRVGDAGFLLGIFLTVGTLGTIKFTEFAPALASGHFAVGAPVITAIALLLFVGATGKSAQIPLYVWLPDAMEGPTPVSALIHAATMVTAGVYMVTRHNAIYQLAPLALDVVAVIGALTAIYAASMGLVQNDIKRILAYSTISQLGYMFLACGVGAFAAGIFHLTTHAFFKALLFLGSGSVIHALSGEQDIRKMGGLRAKIPVTFWTFLVGTLAIAGIPFLAGFYSKDEILLGALNAGETALLSVGLFTALLTAFYMSRLLFLTFFGRFRGGHDLEHHVHESPLSMTLTLAILAAACFVAGRVKVPQVVAPVFRLEAGHPHHVEWLPVLATATALLGIALAFYLYVLRTDLPARIGAALAPLRSLFEAKYYFDDVYNGFAGKVVVEGSESLLWKRLDGGVIDGAVNGLGAFWEGFARRSRLAQTGYVRAYALLILGGAVAVLGYLLWS